MTLHAENERDQDRILVREIEEVLCSPRTEIVADYPTDPRGASFLMLGFSSAGLSIHAVCAITDVPLIITLDRPDPGRWIERRERREG